ncbi:MAG: hypothetical protein EAX96_07055 [Candidatus Lokiarchaeota archaeon]|nr:hypothetical protein [Candidatus Lokiarchaeota archaeon]
MDKLEDFLLTINKKLKDLKINFLFSGALAANLYRSVPRATMDIDIAIPFNEKVLRRIKDNFGDFEPEDWDVVEKRLEIKDKLSDVIIPEFVRFKHESGIVIDFFPIYENFLKRKRTASIIESKIEVIGPEDLIILKSIYYRYKDRDDIENIIGNFEIKLDINYLMKELEEYGKQDIINLIKKLRLDEK